MTRTPSGGDETYQLANMLLPDQGQLAVYDAVYEAKNGKLIAVDAEADAAADDDAKLAGLIGYGQLSGQEFTYQKMFTREEERPKTLDFALAAIKRLPDVTLGGPYAAELDEALPATLAVMVVWGAEDGRRWTVFYRHPKLPERVAIALLKCSAEQIEHQAAAGSEN